MSKKTRPAVVRETRQTGLKLYEVQTINPNAPGGMEAFKAALHAATPEARLVKVKERAKRYEGIEAVQHEVRMIEDLMSHPKFVYAIPFMLLAIERGLDLLDTGRYLPALKRERNFRKQQGAKEVAPKNKYIADVAKQFANHPEKHKQTALYIWEHAPKADDGEAFFYWVGMKFFDRDEPETPLTFQRLWQRVPKACAPKKKKKVGQPS